MSTASLQSALANSGFDLSAFSSAMGYAPAPVQAAANDVELPKEQTVQVGQMKAETPQVETPDQAQAVGQNAGMSSIIQNLSEKAAQALEQQALSASQPANAKDDSNFEQYDKGGKFDVPLLNMLQDALLGDKKIVGAAQGQDCNMNDVTCQNVGTQQQSQGVGQGR